MSKIIEQLFEGVEGLTPEFKEKAEVLFQAAIAEAVDAKLAPEITALTEASNAATTTAIEEQNTKMVETLTALLDESIQEWITENTVPLDSKFKVEISEGLITGLASLFESSGIKFDEAGAAKLADLETKLTEAETKLAEATAKLDEATKTEATAKRTALIEAAIAPLADTSKDRVKKIIESMEFKSDEDLTVKLGYIVEAVAGIGDKKPEGGDGDKGGEGKEKKPEGEAPDKDKQVKTVTEQTQTVKLDPIVEAAINFNRKNVAKK